MIVFYRYLFYPFCLCFQLMVRVMVWFVVNTVYAFQKLLATAPGSAFASMVGRGMEGNVLVRD